MTVGASSCILAFDYGEKRIGVAISSAHGEPARPLTTVDAASHLWSQVGHLVNQYQPRLVVVGWPRGMDAQHTAQTRKAEAFAKELETRYEKTVVLQDEVLTSEEAQKRIDPKLTIRKQRELIDSIAAQIILEDYLRESK